MIAVLEPQCTGASHEKVNSGFLTALRRGHPDQPIRFYCAPSHADAIREALAIDGVELPNIEYRPFPVLDTLSLRGIVAAYRSIGCVLRELAASDTRQLLFLSINPVLLHLVKRLRARSTFDGFKLAFVLHADFEDIANDAFAPPSAPLAPEPTMREKLNMIRPWQLPSKALGFVRNHVRARYARIFQETFREKTQLEYRHSESYRYILLSPHARANAARYIDVDRLNIYAVTMPINFAPVSPAPENAHLKVATFGYGDVVSLGVVARALAARQLTQPYEIRVIGMDNRGLEDVEHVWCPSPGKVLPRREMEKLAADIDVFLILYGADRYRLSCSGSIFEAFSYVKPVAHIGNPCVDAFDSPDAPIGFRHNGLDRLTDALADMIEHPSAHRAELALRRRNLLALRERLSVDGVAVKLREILSF